MQITFNKYPIVRTRALTLLYTSLILGLILYPVHAQTRRHPVQPVQDESKTPETSFVATVVRSSTIEFSELKEYHTAFLVESGPNQFFEVYSKTAGMPPVDSQVKLTGYKTEWVTKDYHRPIFAARLIEPLSPAHTDPTPDHDHGSGPVTGSGPITGSGPVTGTSGLVPVMAGLTVLGILALGGALVWREREKNRIPKTQYEDGPAGGGMLTGFEDMSNANKRQTLVDTSSSYFNNSPLVTEFDASPATQFLPSAWFEVVEGDENKIEMPPVPSGEKMEFVLGNPKQPTDFVPNLVKFTSTKVSRMQALLSVDGQQNWVLTNIADIAQGRNPTMVNGTRIGVNASQQIQDNDIIQIGDVKLRFHTSISRSSI